MQPPTWIETHDQAEMSDAIWALQHAESPLTLLRACADVREYAWQLIDSAAQDALANGATYQDVAGALRISRQAAAKRWPAARDAAEPAS